MLLPYDMRSEGRGKCERFCLSLGGGDGWYHQVQLCQGIGRNNFYAFSKLMHVGVNLRSMPMTMMHFHPCHCCTKNCRCRCRCHSCLLVVKFFWVDFLKRVERLRWSLSNAASHSPEVVTIPGRRRVRLPAIVPRGSNIAFYYFTYGESHSARKVHFTFHCGNMGCPTFRHSSFAQCHP